MNIAALRVIPEGATSAVERPMPTTTAHEFAPLYTRHFHDACRWLRAMGAPDSDMEDLAQEVFLVVRRRLADTEVASPAAWIFGICRRVMSDHRRRAWWKNLFSRRVDLSLDQIAGRDDPVRSLERLEDSRRVHAILGQMSTKRRTALVLFELEGFSGEEIAVLEGVPLKTVWTRLFHARKEFMTRVEELERQERDLRDPPDSQHPPLPPSPPSREVKR